VSDPPTGVAAGRDRQGGPARQVVGLEANRAFWNFKHGDPVEHLKMEKRAVMSLRRHSQVIAFSPRHIVKPGGSSKGTANADKSSRKRRASSMAGEVSKSLPLASVPPAGTALANHILGIHVPGTKINTSPMPKEGAQAY
jgi:hypothetical protein